VGDLNRLYRTLPALQADFDPATFSWIVADDVTNDVIAWCRSVPGKSGEIGCDTVAVFNLTPVVREGYRLGVPSGGTWLELCNTDAGEYGGSGTGNLGSIETSAVPAHGYPASLELTLPPLGALVLGQAAVHEEPAPARKAPARKSAARKAAVPKTPASKAPARKAAASKAPARKAAVSKAPARKGAPPKDAG
jgi:1,4-alpha-glucan branching enzyme